MPDSQTKWEGWGAFGKDSVKGNLRKFEYEPKAWDEEDVDIKIQYSGVCGSDLHTYVVWRRCPREPLSSS